MIRPVRGSVPVIPASAWIAESADVIGNVRLGENVSVWFQTVIRGDVCSIDIGPGSNVQDRVVIHGTYQKFDVQIGSDVSIGHGAMIHGCQIGDRCLIGMGAIVMDGAQIEEDCIIGAGALIPPGMQVKSGSLVIGSPGKIKRELNDSERHFLQDSAERYLMYADWYKSGDPNV